MKNTEKGRGAMIEEGQHQAEVHRQKLYFIASFRKVVVLELLPDIANHLTERIIHLLRKHQLLEILQRQRVLS